VTRPDQDWRDEMVRDVARECVASREQPESLDDYDPTDSPMSICKCGRWDYRLPCQRCRERSYAHRS